MPAYKPVNRRAGQRSKDDQTQKIIVVHENISVSLF
jgi:hypothetical protein